VMSFLMMGRDMRAMEPTELLFWGVMSLGVIAGFATAYPANVWMVARNLKHGLMTLRPSPALGASNSPLATAERLSRHAGGRHAEHGVPASGKRQYPHRMTSDATVPQLAAVGGVSALALLIGIIAPANWVNLRLSARDVGGAIMPPGMVMDRDTP